MIHIFKKIIILGIVFNLFVSGVVKATPITEVSDKPYDEAITILSILNIISGGDAFKVDDPIKRADVVLAIVKALDAEAMAKNYASDVIFKDVTSTSPISGAVNLLSSMGIITGFKGGFFYPDETITYEQAVKMLVCALGYDEYAKNKGGYPFGYITIAQSLGLLKNLGAKTENEMTNGAFAQMLYNALNAEVLDQITFGVDNTRYSSNKGDTWFALKLNIYKAEGIITANSKTGLEVNNNLKIGQIKINEDLIECNNINAGKFIGYKVIYYFKQATEDDDKNLIYFKPSDDNKVITIMSEYINSFDGSNYTYQEETGSKNLTEMVPLSSDILYNGVFVPLADMGKLSYVPNMGSVTLIDNNLDGKNEILLINSYSNYIVDSVSEKDNTIYAKLGVAGLKIDNLNQPNSVTISDTDGNEKKLADLTTWDVLSVEKNINNEVTSITIVKNSISGEVSEISSDVTPIVHIVDGKSLKLSKGYVNLNITPPPIGSNCIYYLDKDGYVAGIDFDKGSAYKFGFIIDAFVNTKIDKNLELNLFKIPDGVISRLVCNSKIRIGMDSSLTSATALSKLKGNNGKVENQLLRYKINSKGLVTDIDLSSTGSGSVLSSTFDSFQLIYSSPIFDAVKGSRQQVYYNALRVNALLSFSGTAGWRECAVLSPTTMFLYVPYNRSDEKGYMMKKPSDYGETMYVAEIYKLYENSEFPDLVIQYPGDGSAGTGSDTDKNKAEDITTDTSITLVEKVTTTINKDDQLVEKLYGYTKGVKEEVVCKNNKMLADLNVEPGDIIRYCKNGDNYIDGAQVLMKASDCLSDEGFALVNGAVKTKVDNSLVPFRAIFGNVYMKNNSLIWITTNKVTDVKGAGDLAVFQPSKIGKVYMFDGKTKTITSSDMSSIRDYLHVGEDNYSKVFVHTQTGEPKSMIIYTNMR